MTPSPSNPLKNLGLSIVRTVVPMFVTWLIGWLTDNFGAIVDESTRTQLVVLTYAIAFGLYYTLVRLAERYVAPWFSWFLGDFSKGSSEPLYPNAIETTATPVPKPPAG